MRPIHHKTRKPQADKYTSGNFALMSASMLPFKKQWQRLTDELPSREAVLVVPEEETPLRQTMRRIVPQLRASGRHVTTLSAKQFG